MKQLHINQVTNTKICILRHRRCHNRRDLFQSSSLTNRQLLLRAFRGIRHPRLHLKRCSFTRESVLAYRHALTRRALVGRRFLLVMLGGIGVLPILVHLSLEIANVPSEFLPHSAERFRIQFTHFFPGFFIFP